MRTEPIFATMAGTSRQTVTIHFEGAPLVVPAGVSVAAALLLAGIDYTRLNPVSQDKRAPFCMMGVCFECLMLIDGQVSVQSCLVEVKDGMQVSRQDGAALLAPADEGVPA
ncbi:(2Fe-2S)-binding protein [Aquamicrobium sp. LC103]|uniref:(2Fe-2S)-binding protein n=1 Tax=Aquamicrobium sp. LC103 TaxID=1120658 RepID=UPI00063ECFD8|nr:(2Fe-2S)-binding protein [Aquamicrobium sp. LC103]TKT69432.1 (2Fe-2S)-binding protein [Aquamicrobium sp. LC103]